MREVMNVTPWSLVALMLLTGCIPKEKPMSETQILDDIRGVLGQSGYMSTKNECESVYAERGEAGGCYLSKATEAQTAQDLVDALVKAGYQQRGTLRQDFLRWAAILEKGPYAITLTVDPLANETDGAGLAAYKAGYQAEAAFSLTNTSGR
ncbi:hypothetical protein [Deinococcus hohokamensis]|uniref:Lipoprotein n=1 Tax=Deinococcus hohokamensis TaxID=309883 RepID=A0ABV9ICI2_9DEIO